MPSILDWEMNFHVYSHLHRRPYVMFSALEVIIILYTPTYQGGGGGVSQTKVSSFKKNGVS